MKDEPYRIDSKEKEKREEPIKGKTLYKYFYDDASLTVEKPKTTSNTGPR
jgi:hypothetical protein